MATMFESALVFWSAGCKAKNGKDYYYFYNNSETKITGRQLFKAACVHLKGILGFSFKILRIANSYEITCKYQWCFCSGSSLTPDPKTKHKSIFSRLRWKERQEQPLAIALLRASSTAAETISKPRTCFTEIKICACKSRFHTSICHDYPNSSGATTHIEQRGIGGARCPIDRNLEQSLLHNTDKASHLIQYLSCIGIDLKKCRCWNSELFSTHDRLEKLVKSTVVPILLRCKVFQREAPTHSLSPWARQDQRIAAQKYLKF